MSAAELQQWNNVVLWFNLTRITRVQLNFTRKPEYVYFRG